jgi:hypothetical protein
LEGVYVAIAVALARIGFGYGYLAWRIHAKRPRQRLV